MREIKFRVWDKIDKKMLMVRALQFDKVNKDNKLITILADDGSDNPTKSFTNKKYGYVSNDIVTTPFENCSAVMQFTGLKDKNGKEIYEGDIVRTKHHGFMEILWKEAGFVFDNLDNITGVLTTNAIKIYEIEVIGNKFENPELLE